MRIISTRPDLSRCPRTSERPRPRLEEYEAGAPVVIQQKALGDWEDEDDFPAPIRIAPAMTLLKGLSPALS